MGTVIAAFSSAVYGRLGERAKAGGKPASPWRGTPPAGKRMLADHLEAQYGIEVAKVSELDANVLRIDRKDGPSWVARAFPAVRDVEVVEGDAEILQYLAEQGYPAER